MNNLSASTGLKGLDEIIHTLQIGDNVVWQVEDISDYIKFVQPFVRRARQEKRKIVYIRFAQHQPVIDKITSITSYHLDPGLGFEAFSTQLHNIIKKEGEGVYYVFDCLSELLTSWANDLMIGNFFMITCPYLFELNTVAYFAILRNNHSFKTVARIRETTQLLLDLFKVENKYYLHPLKVWNRYSPTMYLPHLEQGEDFIPITSSGESARLFSDISKRNAEPEKRKLDYWDRLFILAQEKISGTEKEKTEMLDSLCRLIIGREEKMLALAKKYFTLEDLIGLKSRMIGTGFIGGKAVGMLLARKILLADKSFDWSGILEPHDSFYIGSDVYYSYIVENGWWQLLMDQKTSDGYFEKAPELREKMLAGKFPYEIRDQFQEMAEYFGQSPIIARSSSLLEDSFGNVFAGKYESVFCVNQGSPEERYKNFERAVRQVFASTMDKNALWYRRQRGLDQHDEQMALLVQRVSGSRRKKYFFPDLAGVGISYNTFVWKKDLDPKAGMLRLVFGLGTRAVNRVADDYPRIVALDKPMLQAVAGDEEKKKFSQRRVDELNIERNSLETIDIVDLFNEDINLDLDLLFQADAQSEEYYRSRGQNRKVVHLTFDRLLSETEFPRIFRRLLSLLEKEYGHPVDIEFTANFAGAALPSINLLQCRPLQNKGAGNKTQIPASIDRKNIVFSSISNFMGGNISLTPRRLVYVNPQGYSQLPLTGKYDIARMIGKLNRLTWVRGKQSVLLMGPGRWGTTTPAMGIPVEFSEINQVSGLVEMSFKSGDLIPEISFGTHFFQDLVESDIFYAALFLEKENVVLNQELLDSLPNQIARLLPEYRKYKDVVRVFDFKSKQLHLMSDINSQQLVCFLENTKK